MVQNASEQALDEPETPLSRIPKDEKREPIYEQTDAETAWDGLIEQAEGDEEMAHEVAEDMVKEKTADLENAEKEPIAQGKTPTEKFAARKAHKAKVEQAKQELEHWKAIANVQAERKAKAEAERQEAEKAKAEKKAVEQVGNNYRNNKEDRTKRENRIREWLAPENLEWAEGKSLQEIVEHFGNKLEVIAIVPNEYLIFLGKNVTDNYVYSGKGYFIDHAVNHHDEEPVEEYLKIQDILNNPTEVKIDNSKGRPTLLFIKQYDKFYVEMVSIGEDGSNRIVLHKSFFHRKKMPHKSLPSVTIEKSSAVENSAISPTLKSNVAASSDVSALEASSESKDKESRSVSQENGEKSAENKIETPKKIASYGTLSGEVTDVADLPKDMAYRETDLNELQDLLETGYMRSLPEGKSVEGTDHKVNTRRGHSFQIGKVDGQPHGGKGFAKGAPWSTLGGTLLRGTASKVIIGVLGNIMDWQVGHHGSYKEARPFDEIEHGKPLWVKFDEDGDITDIGAKDIRAWVSDAEGNYHEFIPSNKGAKSSVNEEGIDWRTREEAPRNEAEWMDMMRFEYDGKPVPKGKDMRSMKRFIDNVLSRDRGIDETISEYTATTERSAEISATRLYNSEAAWFSHKKYGDAITFFDEGEKAVYKLTALRDKRGNIARVILTRETFAKDGKTPLSKQIAEERAVEAKEEAKTEETKRVSEEPKPIGKGVFGNIYDQFKGKTKAAFEFLQKHKEGDLQGVFHRKGIGDIDVVWGDKGGGFYHLISKHIGKDKSFSTIDEAAQ